MKHTINVLKMFFLLCCLVNRVQGQELQNLDEKNGFNKFSLGSTKSEYRTALEFMSRGKNGEEEYLYTGKEIKEVFDVSVKDIRLVFYKDKLYTIKIGFRIDHEYNETHILKKLVLLFGDPSKSYPPSKFNNFIHVWLAEQVMLTYSNLISQTTSLEHVSVDITSRKILKDMKNDEF